MPTTNRRVSRRHPVAFTGSLPHPRPARPAPAAPISPDPMNPPAATAIAHTCAMAGLGVLALAAWVALTAQYLSL